MSAELQAHGALISGVRSATKHHKLKMPKGAQKKIDEINKERKAAKKSAKEKEEAPTSVKEGKKPTAKDVRTALKEKKIKPAEAADLNPLGGLTPSVKDVREAVKGGHITPEEGYGLNPNSIRDKRKPKPPKSEPDSGPINVASERVYPSASTPKSIEAPRQWKENGF